MSLADQSQQWYPTSVQVTVFQARNLRIKGKNGTNDAYAIMQVAKDKFSTSVAEKCQAPVWKEEATFDLPLFHQGNADRCTLYIIVMHRALVGLDKLLGQAVINLLDLYDNKSRKKTEWFKLVDKSGKADKDRGEVLLDIQFMRNNMTASMFDLSMKDKPRSRLGKLKDKVRGKKSDGFSDSASAIVPSMTSQVLTDSEEEGDAHSESPSTKKKSKLKSLFAPKTNLHRNHSQSMSVLGTLPEKNSSLSASRSSGLNVESPDVKRKIGFGKLGLGHKRTGSNDSKVSQGPFSLLGRSKQSAADQNTVCINGSHVYSEEFERKTGSTLSLSSSGKGSVEDVRKQHERNMSDASTDSFKALSIPSYKPDTQEKKPNPQQQQQQQQVQQQPQQRLRDEEEERELERKRQVQERLREAEERRRQAESKRIQEMLERQEEQEKKRMQERQRKVEEEAEKRRRREEEERRRMEEQEKQRRQEQEEAQQAEEQERRRQEEARKAEELRHHEETRVTDRLSSLFGIGRKKEERKEGQQQEQAPVAASRRSLKELELPASGNPFEEIPLSPDPLAAVPGPAETQRTILSTPHAPSTGFPSRTAKVSAVKPRLSELHHPETDLDSPSSTTNTADIQHQDQDTVIHLHSESPVLGLQSGSFDTFQDHSLSLAPANITQDFPEFPKEKMENLTANGSSSKSEWRSRALLPPGHAGSSGQHALSAPVDPRHGRVSPGSVPSSGHRDTAVEAHQKPALPLPDYETLFPKKRHGVMGQTRWDHIIAEVNQRRMERAADMSGPEMSVDGPYEPQDTLDPAPILRERPVQKQEHSQPEHAVTRAQSGSRQALQPPRLAAAPSSTQQVERVVAKSRQSKVTERDMIGAELGQTIEPPVPASRSQIRGSSSSNSLNMVRDDKRVPSAKPRQKLPISEQLKDATLEASHDESIDPFPTSSLHVKDPWSVPQVDLGPEDLFSGGAERDFNPRGIGLASENLDPLFESDPVVDPFASVSQMGPTKLAEQTEPENGGASPESLAKKRRAPQPPGNSNLRPGNGHVSRSSGVSEAQRAKRGVKPQDASLGYESSSVTASEEPDDFSSSSGFSSAPSSVSTEGQRTGRRDATTFPAGGKAPMRAWVSPSDTLPAVNHTNGGRTDPGLRRPHPVKPLSATESQHPTSSSIAVSKDLKSISINEVPEKIKVADSGPYTQLTQEELITLVVKQQAELTKRDEKILELEEYIDNLLVRVIEEQPSILMSLAGSKGAL